MSAKLSISKHYISQRIKNQQYQTVNNQNYINSYIFINKIIIKYFSVNNYYILETYFVKFPIKHISFVIIIKKTIFYIIFNFLIIKL